MLKHLLLAASALAVISAGAAQAAPALGLVNGNQLFDFDTATPGLNSALRSITGLQGSDSSLLGLDYRPSNSVLYGLASSGNLYTIDQFSGAATLATTFSVPLTSTTADIAFNPVVDRLRTVGTDGQNLRTNVADGATLVDTTINGPSTPAPTIVAIAYTNQVRGAVGMTTLYDISSAGDLFTQAPPNNGVLNLVGSLGVSSITGFDIDGANGNAAFASTDGSLYSVNLTTGLASLVGAFGTTGVTDIALVNVPEPMSIAMLGFGLAGLAAIRRRV